jgi:hypothetical protein
MLRLVPGRDRQLELVHEVKVLPRSRGLGLCGESDCGRGGQEEPVIR